MQLILQYAERVVLGVVILVVSIITVRYSTQNKIITTLVPSTIVNASALATTTEIELSNSLPIRLLIPKIKVDSLIEHIGVLKDGSMDTPKEKMNVGWFVYSKRPGEVGTSVIDGHYGWKSKQSSAFDKLSLLQVGDEVYVKDSKGEKVLFIVKKIKTYSPKADPSEIFTSKDDVAHLNLITCNGIWNVREKSYTKRLVVFTERKM